MSKAGNLWMEKYQEVQDISDFSEFKREMEALGFSTDEILDHWDGKGESEAKEVSANEP